VLDPASILVSRRARRAKTDRPDLEQLMRVLAALERGEPRVCGLARAPSVDAEDGRRRTRERERLLSASFIDRLGRLTTGDGRPLPPALTREIEREHGRLMIVVEHIVRIEAESRALAAKAQSDSPEAKAVALTRLKSIGPVSARVLAHEVFYRAFDNRRQVGSHFGLTDTPYDSGASRRGQGLGKAGNPRARAIAIELAWLWLRHQPKSELSQWFFKRVGDLKGRVRKIAIAALARKLMVALWRNLETGLVPVGAVLREA
jgi:transposase